MDCISWKVNIIIKISALEIKLTASRRGTPSRTFRNTSVCHDAFWWHGHRSVYCIARYSKRSCCTRGNSHKWEC